MGLDRIFLDPGYWSDLVGGSGESLVRSFQCPGSRVFDSILSEITWDHFSIIVKYMVLPVLVIILSLFFQLVYSWKSFFLLYVNEDYVDLVKVKGLSLNIIERWYIL